MKLLAILVLLVIAPTALATSNDVFVVDAPRVGALPASAVSNLVSGAVATSTNYAATAISSATNALAATLAPTWNTVAIGTNPSVALAVAPNTAYKRTGSGTLTLSSVTGLSPDPAYCVFSGFGSLVLPPGFAVAGSGSYRSGKENHLVLWSTPTTNLVNFLFAQ